MKKSSLSRGVGPKRTQMKRSKSFTPASKEQRAKVKAARIVLVRDDFGKVWGVLSTEAEPVDPMHLTPRSKGGCNDPACTVAAARFTVHRPYDDGELSLLEFFAEEANRLAFLPELQHMLTHLSPVEMVEQLANDRVAWRGVGFVPEEAT
jgi:hypothetical protein